MLPNGSIFFCSGDGGGIGHNSLTISVYFVPEMLSGRDPASALHRALARALPAFDTTPYFTDKRKHQQEAGVVSCCGDGGYRTPVQQEFFGWSTGLVCFWVFGRVGRNKQNLHFLAYLVSDTLVMLTTATKAE